MKNQAFVVYDDYLSRVSLGRVFETLTRNMFGLRILVKFTSSVVLQ